MHHPRRIEKLQQYAETSPLDTPTGQRLFAEKVELQLGFFQAVVCDAEQTELPRI